AAGWLIDPEARAQSLFLTADRGEAVALERRFGPELELLVKPFSVQALEARLLARAPQRAARSAPLLDPILHTRDERLARVLERAWRLARQDVALSIAGELGTGRRALARAIVARSERAALPLIAIEALDHSPGPGDQLERELAAKVEGAGQGTLLLVEPEDWSLRARTALLAALRAADDGEAPRCITLSRVPLDSGFGDGRIEVELAYRLAGPALVLPPIRERAVDQGALCAAIARRIARELGRATAPVEASLLESLALAGFPGNRLGIERNLRSALIQAGSDDATAALVPPNAPVIEKARGPETADPMAAHSVDLRVLERDAIVRALHRTQGNRTHASHALGISVRTLRNKIREYGLR
ncbi:sigma 54-interacting transcriptional regulator, partial [Myxococcota bacterium]|nr:sigma 54-interacting transcriptional regulator [Myxococcota bacterium]